jgi:EAL domain-containing protein (putative c-di-GMP-specific phosphodiesterase class I)/CheY-like chemotaxis protein
MPDAAREGTQSPVARGRVLVAEDDDQVRRPLMRCLSLAGYEVAGAENGRQAHELLDGGNFDAVVSDIAMPELDGIQLLRLIRERDSDLPVVLVTGAPDVATAMQAVRLGALLYLTKPVDLDEIKHVVARAVRLRRIARLKHEALLLVSEGGLGVSDRFALEASFDRMLESLWMAYQPIVRTSDRALFGYEALLRSGEKTLPHVGAILDAAERLGRTNELGRAIRAAAMAPLRNAEPHALLFVNLHARDLMDETLFSLDAPLSSIAERVVLEITERNALDDIDDARAKVSRLRKMGFRIAVDDLGAGYAGLSSFATLEPELVKLDMTLVRNIDASPTKQKLVRSVTSLCNELGMMVVGEGVETRAERDVLVDCGCDLLQGYLLARPDRPFPGFSW